MDESYKRVKLFVLDYRPMNMQWSPVSEKFSVISLQPFSAGAEYFLCNDHNHDYGHPESAVKPEIWN